MKLVARAELVSWSHIQSNDSNLFYCQIIGSFVYSVLRRFLPEEKVESINGLTLTADGKGAVFDVSAEDLDQFLAGIFLHFPVADLPMDIYNHPTIVIQNF